MLLFYILLTHLLKEKEMPGVASLFFGDSLTAAIKYTFIIYKKEVMEYSGCINRASGLLFVEKLTLETKGWVFFIKG